MLYQRAAAFFGATADGVSTTESAKSALDKLFGDGVAVVITNYFAQIGLKYEDNYEYDGELEGVIQPTIMGGQQDLAAAFDDGFTNLGGVAGLIRYSVKKLDKKQKWCIDIIYSADGMYCKNLVGTKRYFNGYAIRVGTNLCSLSVELSYKQGRPIICQQVVYTNIRDPETKQVTPVLRKIDSNGGWTIAKREYKYPIRFDSGDDLITIEATMTRDSTAELKVYVGPYKYGEGGTDNLFSPILAPDYNGNEDDYHDEYYYNYLSNLEMEILVFITIGAFICCCSFVIGVVFSVIFLFRKINKN